MSEYTKGKWTVTTYGDFFRQYIVRPDHDYEVHYRDSSKEQASEDYANAHLIAESPKMFETCKELAGIFPENSIGELDASDFKDRASRVWVVAQVAKAVIAKAKN